MHWKTGLLGIKTRNSFQSGQLLKVRSAALCACIFICELGIEYGKPCRWGNFIFAWYFILIFADKKTQRVAYGKVAAFSAIAAKLNKIIHKSGKLIESSLFLLTIFFVDVFWKVYIQI